MSALTTPAVLAPLDAAVFAWLVVAMGAACVAHMFAWRTTPLLARRERRLHLITALLALLYVAGYLGVLFGAWPILLWSQTFRGVSLIAIPIVWIMPAVIHGRRWEQDRAAAVQLVAAARDLTSSGRD